MSKISKELTNEDKAVCNEHKQFKRKILRLNAITSNRCSREGFDVDKAAAQSERDLNVLGATNGLQEMLAAQMLSVHHLQQVAMAYANEIKFMPERQYYTNAAIKLANCFIQQANLLARLQGNGNQKIKINSLGTFVPLFAHDPDVEPSPIYPAIIADCENLIEITNRFLDCLRSILKNNSAPV